MGKRQKEMPEAVIEIREEIERWRQVRKKRTGMPTHLWEAATLLAEAHGVYRVSRALRLNYESLKSRVRRSAQSTAASVAEETDFVEISGLNLNHSVSSSSVEVEMCRPDGSRMAIRISAMRDVDLGLMIENFWDERR